MKSKLIIIIGVATFASFALSGLFVRAAGTSNILKYLESSVNNSLEQEYNEGVLTEEALSSQKINKIEILSVSSDIEIGKSDSDKIKLVYYKSEGVASSELLSIDGTTMKIDLKKTAKQSPKFKFNLFLENDEVGVLEQNRGATKLLIPDSVKSVQFTTVSGDFKANELVVNDLKHKSVSGDLELQGSYFSIESETVSGDLLLSTKISNPNLKFNTISGDSVIIFDSEPDIKLNFASVSGDMNFGKGLEFESADKKNYILGKGRGLVIINSTSGDLEISKK